jgi:hypothetical protein
MIERALIGFLALGAASFGAALSKAQGTAPSCLLTIITPANNSTVQALTPVTGGISGQTAALGNNYVWVVVHPDGDFYWVQHAARASNGTWRAIAHFGTGATPKGFHFEIQAFVTPTSPLKEGDQLSNFPIAACSYQIVDVNRDP